MRPRKERPHQAEPGASQGATLRDIEHGRALSPAQRSPGHLPQSQSEVLAVRVSHGSNYPAFLFALVPSVTVNLVSFIEDTFGDLAAPQTPLGAVCWGVSSLSPLSKNHTLSEHCPPNQANMRSKVTRRASHGKEESASQIAGHHEVSGAPIPTSSRLAILSSPPPGSPL